MVLLGRLVADPEHPTTQTGTSLASFTLAVPHGIARQGEEAPSVDFHRIIAWRKLADFCAKILKKGMMVLVEGRLSNHSYEGAKGTVYVTEVVMHELNILTWPDRGTDAGDPPQPIIEEVDVAGDEVGALQ